MLQVRRKIAKEGYFGGKRGGDLCAKEDGGSRKKLATGAREPRVVFFVRHLKNPPIEKGRRD